MYDYRLHVFDTVAGRLSFTKAAEELCISQPAVTRHVKELERRLGVSLFERHGNGIALTGSGRLLRKHVEILREASRRLEYELALANDTRKGSLRLGASTTIAQYVLPPVLADFHLAFADIRLSLMTANTERIERALLRNDIAFGVIEGESRRRDIQYLPFAEDELVLVGAAANPLVRAPMVSGQLPSVPMVVREPGSGTLEVLARALRQKAIRLSDLQIEMTLGSTEAIKSYLMHSGCLAFVSCHAVVNEIDAGFLRVVRLEDLSIRRRFSFISRPGVVDGLADLFMRFASSRHRPLPPVS